MTARGEAYALATVIYTKDPDTSTEDQADVLYHAVDAMGLTDEAKADLYAQIAEQLGAATKFFQAVEIIEQAMIRTQRRFAVG